MAAEPTLADLRRLALKRSLFAPTTLPKAIARLGFVQADPLRAPARAQDLVLRHRVQGYRAGDLERRYPRLAIEEDYFVNYGFLPRTTQQLLHPRTARRIWPAERQQQAQAVLDFVRERGVVHPREVDAEFQHGRSRNWFGGHGKASTQLLDEMHYRGLVRTARRDGGIRLYGARPAHPPAPDPAAAMDALVDVIVGLYAPLPAPSLSALMQGLRTGAPQWDGLRRDALQRALARLPGATVDGLRWCWPAGECPRRAGSRSPSIGGDEVRLLAPFDPLVWDRRRFELFWGWPYRFEAYVPAAQRVRGHYALPLLWREAVIGWANLSVRTGRLQADIGHVSGQAPSDAGFQPALDDELQRISDFLGLVA